MMIVGHVVFCGTLDIPPDPDAAEIELRHAGYAVARLPDRLQKRIQIPGDDFLQALIDIAGATDEAEITGVIMDEVEEIVARYGGACMECGAEPADYRPAFDDLFEVIPRSH